MPPRTTKTLGPLHLEDLEPRRFEDLIRQLAYDFRPWRMLEATGRAGSDDGFDARGFEMVGPQPAVQEDESDEPEVEPGAPDRLWLIQCKREREIGPSKLVGYLDAIPSAERPQLHGIVFAAACDFSKRARDEFYAKAREFGIAEAHLWGKAEIEDQLFQAKNDHLLFAYFGFSLQVRRRSLKTDVRARLAMKRKCKKHLTEGVPALVRDASDDRYPYQQDDTSLPRIERGRWKPLRVKGCFHDGVHFELHKHFAFIDDDGEHWDFVEAEDRAPLADYEDPWRGRDEDTEDAHHSAWDLWNDLPEYNRAFYEWHLILPYENILDIDEGGDEHFSNPHIYTVPFTGRTDPFRENCDVTLETISRWSPRSCWPKEETRVEKFPRKVRAEPAADADAPHAWERHQP